MQLAGADITDYEHAYIKSITDYAQTIKPPEGTKMVGGIKVADGKVTEIPPQPDVEPEHPDSEITMRGMPPHDETQL